MYCTVLHFHAVGRNKGLQTLLENEIPSVREVKPVFLDIIGALKEKQKKGRVSLSHRHVDRG